MNCEVQEEISIFPTTVVPVLYGIDYTTWTETVLLVVKFWYFPFLQIFLKFLYKFYMYSTDEWDSEIFWWYFPRSCPNVPQKMNSGLQNETFWQMFCFWEFSLYIRDAYMTHVIWSLLGLWFASFYRNRKSTFLIFQNFFFAISLI